MVSGWHFKGAQTPSQGEVEAMAAVLEGRHGVRAAEVAEFLAMAHSLKGDRERGTAWNGVADVVRRKTEERLCGDAAEFS